MPEVIQAPEENATQPTQSDSAPTDGGATRVRPVEFPEAPPDAPAAPGGQLDILLDMDVPVTVVLGETCIPVRRLLQLGPGSVLKLQKPIEAPAELFLKDSKFADANVVVVDNQFAVRVTQVVKAAATSISA
jgi:flagellar motor switch protein FliN/FliY